MMTTVNVSTIESGTYASGVFTTQTTGNFPYTLTFTSPLNYANTFSVYNGFDTNTLTYIGYYYNSGSGALSILGEFFGQFGATSYALYGPSSGSATTPITVDALPCFVRNTRIATSRGQVAVQDLSIGDLVVTASGATRPVVSLGQRDVDTARHLAPSAVWPVVVRAGAFAAGLPVRDLFLSPDHAVFVSGVLIPIRHLINGRIIVEEHVAEVTYYHVELPIHDVILAEGLPCESYLDTGNRGAFEKGGTVVGMHPDFAPHMWEAQSCAPLVVAGPERDRVRAILSKQLTALPAVSGRHHAINARTK